MFRLLILAALLAIAASPPSQPPAKWPTQKFVRWQPEWGSRTISVAGTRVRVEIRHCGVERPLPEGCWQGSRYLVVTATSGQAKRAVLTGAPSVAQYVGIGALPGSTAPAIILVSDDGGSGGCAQIDLAMPEGHGLHYIRVAPDHGSNGAICPIDAEHLHWPADLTGRHRIEFLLPRPVDPCDCVSHAGAWITKRVIAIENGSTVDVSSDPALAPIFRADMARALEACRHRTEEAAGPCGGLAYDAALLGQLQSAWPVIDGQVRRGCRVANQRPCADSDKLPVNLHARIADGLRTLGLRS